MPAIQITHPPLLTKTIFEVRFRPNLSYYSDAFKLASAFEPDFEDWQTSQEAYQAVLYSKSSRELLRIGSDGVAIVLETEDYQRLEVLIDKVLKLLIIPNNFQEIRRIGIRQIRVIGTNAEFGSLAEKMTKSFENHYEEHQELALDVVDDYAFILDGIKNGFKNHIRFGPVKPQEAIDRFNSNFSQPEAKDNSIFIDIDVFNDEIISEENLSDNIDSMIEESKRIIKGYQKLVAREVRQ